MKTFGMAATVAALVLTTACSNTRDDLTTQSLADELAAFDAAFGSDVEANTFADLGALPTEGTASYAGYIGIGADTGGRDFLLTDATYASPLALDIALETGEVSGLANEFVAVATMAPLTGGVTLEGAFYRDADVGEVYPIVGEVAGVLTDTQDRTISVDGGFVADLFGDSAAGLSGASSGALTTRDTLGGIVADETYSFSADIIATRDDLD